MTTPITFECMLAGRRITGRTLGDTMRLEWADRRRKIAERMVASICIATGEPFHDGDGVVLVIGNGTPLRCNFELPLSTVERLGFELAVHASHVHLHRMRRNLAEFILCGLDPVHAFGMTPPWQIKMPEPLGSEFDEVLDRVAALALRHFGPGNVQHDGPSKTCLDCRKLECP